MAVDLALVAGSLGAAHVVKGSLPDQTLSPGRRMEDDTESVKLRDTFRVEHRQLNLLEGFALS
jgi:hypothetical protein